MEVGYMESSLVETGRRTLRGLAAGLLIAAAATAQDVAWEQVDLEGNAIWQDPDWRAGHRTRFSREPSRLAADDLGRIYLSNGPDVLIGAGFGRTWRKVETPMTIGIGASTPIAVAGQGLVLTRLGFSRNGGATWDAMRAYASAFALQENGTRLQGSGYDAIERAAPGDGVWTRVHMGRTFGNIHQFAVSDGPSMFALPSYAPLLFSRDSGKTWSDWSVPGKGAELWGGRVQTLAMDRRAGNSVWLAARKSDLGPANILIHGTLALPSLDTLAAGMPDSSVTAIVPANDGSLWLGTEGQGVWFRRQTGDSFTRANGGLADLFVESMVEASDGRINVLTRSGLYRQKADPTGLRPRASRISAAPARATIHITGLSLPLRNARFPGHRNAIPTIRTDGRIVIFPGPHP